MQTRGFLPAASSQAMQTMGFLSAISQLFHDSTIASPSTYNGNPDGNIIPYLTDDQETSAVTAYNQESFRVPSNPKLLPPPERLICHISLLFFCQKSYKWQCKVGGYIYNE
eukprot:12037430-Ditylum_brightwellii.AAC.1